MKQIANCFVFLLTIGFHAHAQNITKAEYFFDSDPGFGQGINIPLMQAPDLPALPFTADVSMLPAGIHRLYVRSMDENTKWSITNAWLFYRTANTHIANISRIEYFTDNDPGFGKATAVTIVPGNNISNLDFSADISAVTPGVHQFFIRSLDADGLWSETQCWMFYKASVVNPHLVSVMEYFFDTDPGFGNGSPISVAQSSNIANQNIQLNLSTLNNGPHKLYVRSKDDGGNWSITNYVEFTKVDSPLPLNWLNFTAERTGDFAYLHWTVVNETGNDFYEIEHSADGTRFVKAGVVDAKGGAGQLLYDFVHKNPIAGKTNFYRIKQIDVDGKFSYSVVRQVMFAGTEKLSITPNPATSFLNISAAEKYLTVHVFDASGKKLLTQKLVIGFIQIDISHLAKGSYVVLAEKDGRVVESKKMVKQ